MACEELSEWAKIRPLIAAVLAKARGGRECPFAVGEQVRAHGKWGIVCDDLRRFTDANPDAVLTITEITGDRWLSLLSENGRIYGHPDGSGYGASYFRTAGECGEHFPAYGNSEQPGSRGYFCQRCGEPMQAITRALTGEES
jgi:hypothetical protein